MKRFVYATAAIVLTGVLVLLVIAVAQRDARISDSSPVENTLVYANKAAKPISGAYSDGSSATHFGEWPPLPIVRGNDSPNVEDYASPAAYAGGGPTDFPRNNVRKPNSTGRLAEPPPLSALNRFLTPMQPGSSNPLDPGQLNSSLNSNKDKEGANDAPQTLPSVPSAISSYPGNPSLENQPLPANLPNAQLRSDASSSIAAPSLAAPSLAAPSLSTPSFNAPSPNGSSASLGGPQLNGLSTNEPQTNGAATLGSPRMPSDAGHSSAGSPIQPAPSNPTEPRPVATLGMPMPSPSGSGLNGSNPSRSTPTAPYLPSTAPYAAPAHSAPISNLPAESAFPSAMDPPAKANASTGTRTLGFSSAAPGLRQLDGSQNPSMEIQKRAPNEVQVGIPATFTVLVRNVGNATAYDVQVVDAVPKGARLVRTSPQAQPNGPSGLTWKLGEMAAGSELTITIELVPESEGEIGSVASVNFAAQASVRTMSTQPKLVVKQQSEALVLGGENVRIMIDVTNMGTGTARNVRLEEDVPPNMRHASGSTMLERDIGDLAPGETYKLDIEFTAVSAGKVSNVLRAIAQNAATNESTSQIEVVSPKLQIGLEGPKLRYLERQATYTASITNTGSAIATNVDLILYLPHGLQFNSAENRGEYVSNQHAVLWQLAELAAGKTAATKVTLLPVEEGDFVLRTQATADSIRAEAVEKPVRVEGQSELAFSIEDDNDPIETDGKTTYIVKILNTGTRVDNDVQLAIELPDGASIEQVDAPVNYQASQRAIQFSPIAQMKSKDQQTIRFVVRHAREGTHVVRAQLKSKLRPGAVIKEESTQVYRDQ